MLTGNTEKMSYDVLKSLTEGVEMCFSLLGMMSFWSGIMNVFRCGGVLEKMSFFMNKPIKMIFGRNNVTQKDVENLSASFAADFLGLGNAALPFGIEAMKSLNGENREYAEDGAIMHAVLNTVPIQLLPTTLISLRSRHGSVNQLDVVPMIWFCSIVITAFAVAICRIFACFSKIAEKRKNA